MSKVATAGKMACDCPSTPPNRADFLPFWVDLTLDVDTAYYKLKMSGNGKEVELTDDHQPYPENPKRFRYVPQVLCGQGMTGKKYWEIEWVGSQGAGIAVSSDKISRDSALDECRFGCNALSWRFQDGVKRDFLYNDVKTAIPSYYNIIGVFLDTDNGIIKFYNVTPDLEEMTLLDRSLKPETRVEGPLYAGFWLCEGTKLKILPKQLGKRSQRI